MLWQIHALLIVSRPPTRFTQITKPILYARHSRGMIVFRQPHAVMKCAAGGVQSIAGLPETVSVRNIDLDEDWRNRWRRGGAGTDWWWSTAISSASSAAARDWSASLGAGRSVRHTNTHTYTYAHTHTHTYTHTSCLVRFRIKGR